MTSLDTPPQVAFGSTFLEEQEQLARDTYRLRVRSPEIAGHVRPGQFVMLRWADTADPLLARPLAVYDIALDADGSPAYLDLVYLVVGKLTSKLARATVGTPLEIWGPLGNGFSGARARHLVMVAGGIGYTPFLAVALAARGKWPAKLPGSPFHTSEHISFCFGVRSREFLPDLHAFEKLGVKAHVSTDDGSFGHHGLVTDLLQRVLDQTGKDTRVLCCGPEPMMAAVSQLTLKRQIPCEVSLETPMACGLGICFSCVAKVRDDADGWDYRRTCVEGPIFSAGDIVW